MSDPSFPVGTWVRITAGPLKNLEGVVIRRRGQRDRFAAVVNFLGQSATVELEDWQVEEISSEESESDSGPVSSRSF